MLALLHSNPTKDVSNYPRSSEATVSTHTPTWGLPFLFFEYLLFAFFGLGPARVTLAKSTIMATSRIVNFILIDDLN